MFVFCLMLFLLALILLSALGLQQRHVNRVVLVRVRLGEHIVDPTHDIAECRAGLTVLQPTRRHQLISELIRTEKSMRNAKIYEM